MNTKPKTYTKKDLKEALVEMVKRGYLKKTSKGWVDSNKVKLFLKEGKSRQQIARILDKGTKQ